MGRNFLSARAREQQARLARNGTHYSAKSGSIKKTQRDYSIGESVRIITTGVIARVQEKASWGDYVLEGQKGYFPSQALEPESS